MWLTERTVWIWVGLVGICGLLLFMFGMLAVAQRRLDDRIEGLPSTQDIEELEAIAAVALEEAQQAALDADRAEEDLARAEALRDQAWQAHSVLSEALERVSAELDAMPVEATLPDPEQREVSRAARDAYRRGELTVEQLRAVWHRLGGWDRTLEDKTHELSRLRAETAEAWRRYHLAALAERRARETAEAAQATERVLRQEAVDAAREAQSAQMSARRRR